MIEDQTSHIYEKVELQDVAQVDNTYVAINPHYETIKNKVEKENVSTSHMEHRSMLDSVKNDRNSKKFPENVDVKTLDQEFDRKMYKNLQDEERNTLDIGDKISDITLPDRELYTPIQQEKQVIKPVITSEVKDVSQNESRLGQVSMGLKRKLESHMSSLLDTPISPQTISQPKIVPEISLVQMSETQSKPKLFQNMTSLPDNPFHSILKRLLSHRYHQKSHH